MTTGQSELASYAEIVSVTPELAEQWLQANVANRTIRRGKVNSYAAQMARGEWTISESAICFNVGGRMLNGQHRCQAVIQSGITVPMLVLRNVPTAAMDNMDTGAKRTAADVLNMRGETNAHLTASVARTCILYLDDRLYRDRKVQEVSNANIAAFLEEHPDLRASVTFGSTTNSRIGLSPTSIGVVHWLLTRNVGDEMTKLFFEQLISLVGQGVDSPLLAFNSRIRQLKNHRAKLNHREEMYLLVKTWNYWVGGRKVKTLTLHNKKGTTPRIPEILTR